MTKHNIALLGLGNILLKDEGVGVHVVKLVEKKFRFSPPISIIDGGTSGGDLLPIFDDHSKILIIDAVNFDQPAGYIQILQDDEILQQLTTKLTMHHIGLADMLSSAKLLEYEHEEICLIGIQPQIIDTGLDLSEKIQSHLPDLENMIMQKLKEWGISGTIL